MRRREGRRGAAEENEEEVGGAMEAKRCPKDYEKRGRRHCTLLRFILLL